jgi:Ca2+-binding RTX toxin-like protein
LGTIAGFGLPDHVDLADIPFGAGTTETFQEASSNLSGTLTVTSGTHSASLDLLGQYVTGQFNLATDGHGGTLVSDPPVPTPPTPDRSSVAVSHFDASGSVYADPPTQAGHDLGAASVTPIATDTLRGVPGVAFDDLPVGAGGTDVLVGGASHDTVTGDTGHDTYAVGNGGAKGT